MKILLVDDDDSRREIIAAHTGADVVRVMPRELFARPELLLDADGIALDHDMCEGGDITEVPCPAPGAAPWVCECKDGRDVVRWLLERLGSLRHECRIVMISANCVAARGMADMLNDSPLRGARKVHVGECSAARWGRYDSNPRAALRAAFGLPLDSEVTT